MARSSAFNRGRANDADSRSDVIYRCRVASRLLAALIGGYLLANALAILLVRLLHFVATSRADAVLIGVLFSFIAYLCAVLWAFAARSAMRAWGGLLLVTAVCAAFAWLLGSGLGGGGAS